jgi:multidrug efflux pump subunit AcrA (membrane-fusion protein)
MPGIAIAAAQGPRLTAPGRIQNPAGIMAIGTAASGVVKDVLVHEGSRVHAGDVLAALSCAPLEAEKQLRTAELQAAEAILDRVRHGPRREEIAVAEAVVGYSNARAGEFISLAVPAALLRLLPDAPLQVRAEIDARDLPRACVAQPATFTADAFASTPMRGQVEPISPVISARMLFTTSNEARTPDVGRVVLRLENGGANLPSGLPVTVVFGPCPSN